MTPTKLIILFAFLSIGEGAISQQQEVSSTFGYGGVDYDRFENFVAVAPISGTNRYESIVFGFGYHYSFGERKLFRLNTGLQYHFKSEKRYSGGINLHQIYVPAGINMNIGKRLHLIYGIGIQTKLLIPHSNMSDFEAYPIQLGWYFNLGVGYRIGGKLDIAVTYQMNSDITPVYKKNFLSPGGAAYGVDFKEFEGVLQLGFFYTLKEKEDKFSQTHF